MTLPAKALAAALGAVGTPDYLARFIDLIGALAPHDRVTAVRYSTEARPQFLTHRNFSDELARRYLDAYYPYDPFYAYWRDHERPGIVPLRRFTTREFKQGIYIAEFLYSCVIADEIGVLLRDGGHWALAVFLERSERRFSGREIERLTAVFPALAALHDLQRRLAEPPARAEGAEPGKPVPRPGKRLPEGLWTDLTGREREIVRLVLEGHPSSGIAERLGISPGTVRIHRQSIYAKLDITSEREIFLQYIDFAAGGGER